MDRKMASRKKHSCPKDWARRARVLVALSERQLTVTELARRIERSQGYVSAVIWGVDRARSAEKKIARELGKNWEELFSSCDECKGVAA